MNRKIVSEEDFNKEYNITCTFDDDKIHLLNKLAQQNKVKGFCSSRTFTHQTAVKYSKFKNYIVNMTNSRDDTFFTCIYKVTGSTYNYTYYKIIYFKETAPTTAVNFFKLLKLKAFL